MAIASWTKCGSLIAIGITLVGCRGERVQSSLHPEGPAAQGVAQLWWVLLVVLGVYTLAVFALTAVAVFGRKRTSDDSQENQRWSFFASTRFVVIGGIILPAAIVIPLLVYSSAATAGLRQRETGLTLRVIGHRWWWEVQYPEHGIETANRLVIPVGEPVGLELSTEDVIHSFWVPQLHGKTDMIPGRTTQSWLQADRPGIYRGQCAEYCGAQHAHMAFEVIVLPQEQFVAWLNGEGTLETDALTTVNVDGAGWDAFSRHGCAACHAISGTLAVGEIGPDLSDLPRRQMLAAATIANDREHLLAWIRNPQAIKPGAKMPPTLASEEDLKLIVDFLQNLH